MYLLLYVCIDFHETRCTRLWRTSYIYCLLVGLNEIGLVVIHVDFIRYEIKIPWNLRMRNQFVEDKAFVLREGVLLRLVFEVIVEFVHNLYESRSMWGGQAGTCSQFNSSSITIHFIFFFLLRNYCC